MTHTDYTLWMSLALDGMLTLDEKQALYAHLDTCPACHAIWQSWLSIDQRLRATPMVAPAPGFVARLEARRRARSLRHRGAIGALLLLSGAISTWSVLFLSTALASVWWLVHHPSALIPFVRFATTVMDVAAIWLKLTRMLRESLITLFGQPTAAVYALVMLILAMIWIRVVIWQRPEVNQATR